MMFFETLIFIVVSIFIAILFYKQANEQFEIVQLEATQMNEITSYYADHSPIVIRQFQTPVLGTANELMKRPHIVNLAIQPGRSFRDIVINEKILASFQFQYSTAEFLAKEAGLPIWFEKHLFPSLTPSPYTKWLYSTKTSLWPHHRGLFKTTAFQTIIMPTQGTAKVSLLLQASEAYLPTGWKNRSFSSLTTIDTPLIAQIQFIEVKVRKGTLLLLPAHMIVDIQTHPESTEPCWCFVGEIHHWISRFAT